MIERIKVQDWKYNAKLDITTDFYGRQIAKGDQLIMTLNM